MRKPVQEDPPERPIEMSVRGLELQEAALTLISERGYHGTTMKHIAAAVGMQAPSLYNHVGSKQEILRRIMTRGMQRLMDHQTEALTANTNPPARLRAITEAHVLLHIRYRRSAMIAARELGNLEEPVQGAVRAQRDAYEHNSRVVIQEGLEDGSFVVKSAKLASFAIIEMATSVAVWFKEGATLSPNEVAREYGVMALRIVGVGDAAASSESVATEPMSPRLAPDG
jgi:AcrR family transcriptional regulator